MYFSIYDNEERLLHRSIDRTEFLYINPFIVQVRNNSELIIISKYDCMTRCIYQLDSCKLT
jgi:hypothetical protein